MIRNKLLITTFLTLSLITGRLSGAPFFGGFYISDNSFNKDHFTTAHLTGFYLDQMFNEKIRLYTRLSAGVNYRADYWGANLTPYNLSIPLNIDLLYLELRLKRGSDESGFDLFFLRGGRIPLTQGSGFLISLKGDGIDTFFTKNNFKLRLFAITNSLNFSPLFDFQDGSSSPIFTNWDRKRYPLLVNMGREGYEGGFNSDITSEEYNFFFSYADSTDYSSEEMTRLNAKRQGAVLAGRIFTGFSIELLELFQQNFALHFLANLDLIPEEFVVTYPGHLSQVANSFGGRYSSFYLDFSATGKITRGLYYNFEAVYETGFNATYYDNGSSIEYHNALINSFAISSGLTYFFNHITRPTLELELLYAHGDEDVEFTNGIVSNRAGQDNSYRSPTSPSISYAADIPFSNLAVIRLSNTIKPFSMLKNRSFARLSLDSSVTVLFRPFIKGAAFLPEKIEYLAGGASSESGAKSYLGSEFELDLTWQVFSDFGFQVKGAILIPNYLIYEGLEPIWKVGVGLNFSF